MTEKPLEWISVFGESTAHKLGRFASIIIGVILLLMYSVVRQIPILLIGAVLVFLFIWMQIHAFVEYEFCYFDGDIDVSAIYNRARRKQKMTFKLDEIDYMVKKVEPQEVTKYFCNKSNQGNVYTIVANLNGKRTALVLESDPEFTKILEMKHKVR